MIFITKYDKLFLITTRNKIMGIDLQNICRSGGMADALDSKSSVGNYMRVQVPPSAPNESNPNKYERIALLFYHHTTNKINYPIFL